MDISKSDRETLVHTFRSAHEYDGALTPVVGDKPGKITFRKDVEKASQSKYTVSSNSQDDDVTVLEAATWVLEDDEIPAPAAPARSRRGSVASISSVLTIWPSAVDDRPVEQDGFGHAVEAGNSRPDAAHLARHRLPDPNDFELVDLEEQHPGSVNRVRSDHRGDAKPVAAIPAPLPHRSRSLTDRVPPESYLSTV